MNRQYNYNPKRDNAIFNRNLLDGDGDEPESRNQFTPRPSQPRTSPGPLTPSPSTSSSSTPHTSGPQTSEPRTSQQPDFTSRQESSSGDKPLNIGHGIGRLVIAIDYGTTFTGVGLAIPRADTAHLDDIAVIQNWGPKMENTYKVPSVYSYTKTRNGEMQWGRDLSPDAVTLVNMKLELEIQPYRIEELQLLEAMIDNVFDLQFDKIKRCQGSLYTWKDPEGVMRDYLEKIFGRVKQRINLTPEQERDLKVDLVITVPVGWSYRAQNSTLKAILAAGFNKVNFPNLQDMILITEPEAAAIYTARYLKEQSVAKFLRVGQCFVICDAGGGTVDLVSFKIEKLEPLELKRMTKPTSAKCGAAFVDTRFKTWLKAKIGDKYWKLLDPNSTGGQVNISAMESHHMRAVMERFDNEKRKFSSESSEIKIAMPPGELHTVNTTSLRDGELTISSDDMKSFFDPSIDTILDLVDKQIDEVEDSGNNVKNVFLVGGFGESEFLREELEESLGERKIKMRKPGQNNSWTAVLQGAVIHGIEKAEKSQLKRMVTCTKNYGVSMNTTQSLHNYNAHDRAVDPRSGLTQAKNQMVWIVKEGDLILSDSPTVKDLQLRLSFDESAPKKHSFSVYEYVLQDEEDELPTRYAIHQHELQEVVKVECDLSNYPRKQFSYMEHSLTQRPYLAANVVLRATTRFEDDQESTEFELLWNGDQLFSKNIEA